MKKIWNFPIWQKNFVKWKSMRICLWWKKLRSMRWIWQWIRLINCRNRCIVRQETDWWGRCRRLSEELPVVPVMSWWLMMNFISALIQGKKYCRLKICVWSWLNRFILRWDWPQESFCVEQKSFRSSLMKCSAPLIRKGWKQLFYGLQGLGVRWS